MNKAQEAESQAEKAVITTGCSFSKPGVKNVVPERDYLHCHQKAQMKPTGKNVSTLYNDDSQKELSAAITSQYFLCLCGRNLLT